MAWPTPWPQGMVKGIAGLETKVTIGLAHKPGHPSQCDRSHPHPKGHDHPLSTAGQGCRRASGARRLQLWSPKSPLWTRNTLSTIRPHAGATTSRGGQHSAWGACRSSRWDTWRQPQPDPSRAPGRRGSGSVFARRWRGAHRALPKSSPFTALRSVDVEIHCTTSTE